jgi:hypothetical protein
MQTIPKVNNEKSEEEKELCSSPPRMHSPLVKQVSVFLPTISRTLEEDGEQEEEEMPLFPCAPAPLYKQLGIPFIDEITQEDIQYNDRLRSILNYGEDEVDIDEVDKDEVDIDEDELFSCRYNQDQPLHRFVSVQTVDEITQEDKEYNEHVRNTEKSLNEKYKM